jgi:anti-anti-sigma factor
MKIRDVFSAEFNIQEKMLGKDAVALPKGPIDSMTHTAFHAALESMCKKGAENLLVDMFDVDYLSSAGLSVMIQIMKDSKIHGRFFGLFDLQPGVRRVLEIAKLDMLEIKPQGLNAKNPFFDYIREKDAERQELRKKRQTERQRLQELQEKTKKK